MSTNACLSQRVKRDRQLTAAASAAEELADQTLDRVARKLEEGAVVRIRTHRLRVRPEGCMGTCMKRP